MLWPHPYSNVSYVAITIKGLFQSKLMDEIFADWRFSNHARF